MSADIKKISEIYLAAAGDVACGGHLVGLRAVWDAAIEEAAKLCDGDRIVSGSNGPLMDHGYAVASEIHAKAIRKLSKHD